jgi:hypothetical protein
VELHRHETFKAATFQYNSANTTIKLLIVQDFFFNELSKRKESNVTTIVAVTHKI